MTLRRPLLFFRRLALGGTLIVLPTLPMACAAPPSEAAVRPGNGDDSQSQTSKNWETLAKFEVPVLAEISGLAASARRPGVFWAHNDSGGAPALHAFEQGGTFLGSVTLHGVGNVDWEDLAAFEYEGEPHLLIGDTGDNLRERKTVQLHAVLEPRPDADGRYDGSPLLTPSWSMAVRFENGPEDCEAIAVVPGENLALLLNKDSKRSVIYQVALAPRGVRDPVQATELATLPPVSNATGSLFALVKAGLLGSRATAMDVSPDGRQAAVLTYTDVRLFRRRSGQSWAEAFQVRPDVIALPSVYQPEALCFGRDGRSLYVSSEESPTPLLRYGSGSGS